MALARHDQRCLVALIGTPVIFLHPCAIRSLQFVLEFCVGVIGYCIRAVIYIGGPYACAIDWVAGMKISSWDMDKSGTDLNAASPLRTRSQRAMLLSITPRN
jgi:hypothetical protein